MKKALFLLLLPVLLCVIQTAKAQPGFYKAISGSGVQVGTVCNAGGVCVTPFGQGNNYQDLQNVIDADLNTAAASSSLQASLCAGGVSVRSHKSVYPAGYIAGYAFCTPGGISQNLCGAILISTYLHGVLQEEQAISNVVSSAIANNERRHYACFTTTKSFDEVRLRCSGISASSLCGIKICCALAFPKNCTGNPGSGNNATCNKPVAGILSDVTFNDTTVCTGCSLLNPQNLNDGDRSNYTSLIVPSSAMQSASVGVLDRGNVYPAGYTAGFVIGANNASSVISAAMLNSIVIETYLYGQLQQSATYNNGAGALKMDVLALASAPLEKIGFSTTLPFNEVRMRQVKVANMTMGLSRIYYAFTEQGSCSGCKTYFGSACSGKYSGCIVNNTCSTIYTGAYGNCGSGCGFYGWGGSYGCGGYTGCGYPANSLNNAGAVVSGYTTDVATYTPSSSPSSSCGGILTVKNNGTRFAAGTFAGFDLSLNGTLPDSSFLRAITIRTFKTTYSGITLVESATVANGKLMSANVAAGNTRMLSVGFKTTQPFNVVQIEINNGVAYTGYGSCIRIHGAYTLEDSDGDGVPNCMDVCCGDDTKDSDNDGIPDACDVCKAGSVAPAIAGGGVLKNVCPAATVALPGVSGSMPPGTKLTWHTGAVPTNTNKLTAAQAAAVGTSGVYYAAFYDSIGNCYSPTTPDTVKINNCGYADLTPDFVFGDGVISGYNPVNLGVQIKNIGAAATNAAISIMLTISATPAANIDMLFDSTTNSIAVGGTTITVTNADWTLVPNPVNGTISLTSKPGVSIPAQSSAYIGLTINQSAANFGDPVELQVVIAPLSGGEIDTNNNVNYQPIVFTSGSGGITHSRKINSSVVDESNIKVYPNPAYSQVTVSGLKEGQTICLYSVYGQMLVNRKVSGSAESVDISSYAAGSYILLVREAGGNTAAVSRIQKIN
ncbi:T9SS type A sorting domain-containing protein [Chitinophagaceae bacterium MMS25-I14]